MNAPNLNECRPAEHLALCADWTLSRNLTKPKTIAPNREPCLIVRHGEKCLTNFKSCIQNLSRT